MQLLGTSDKDTLATAIKDTRYDLASYLDQIPKGKGK